MMIEETLDYNADVTKEKLKASESLELASWAKKQGIINHGVEFPAYFGQQGHLRGTRSCSDIGPFQAVLAVPQKCLMMSRRAYEDPDIGPLLQAHPYLFDPKKTENATYNAVVMLMLKERTRGKDSDLYHVISIVKQRESYPWLDDSIFNFIRDQCMIDEISTARDLFTDLWEKIRKILEANPSIFGDKVSKEDFAWAYYFANSRCFGEEMPALVYAPVIDLMNHEPTDALLHCSFIHLKLEKLSHHELADSGYKRLPRYADLSTVFPEWKFSPKVQVKYDPIEFVEAVSKPVIAYKN